MVALSVTSLEMVVPTNGMSKEYGVVALAVTDGCGSLWLW
jgi:hypothetical protein